jgi:hypothetical protein
MHERLAFVDHPPPPQRLRLVTQDKCDPLDPQFVSAVRWKRERESRMH